MSIGLEDPIPPLPRVLILDYHDSYTNNLLTLFVRLYSDEEVRAKVVVVQADSLDWPRCQRLLEEVDCVVLSPGPGRPDNPTDIGFALDLIRTTQLPVLGICLGLQALAVAYGGRIIPTPEIQHGQVIPVTHSCDGLFDLLNSKQQWRDGSVEVVVYNSLTIDPCSLPDDLELMAWTTKNEKLETIQGLSHKTKPQWGIQFHPESISSTSGTSILLSFLTKTSSHHSNPPSYPPLSTSILDLSSTSPPCAVAIARSKSGPSLTLVEERFGELGMERSVGDVFQAAFDGKSGLGEIWLDGESPNIRTTSTLANPTFILAYSLLTHSVTCHHTFSPDHRATSATMALTPQQTFWDWFSAAQTELKSRLTSTGAGKARWAGGWAGFWGYEMKAGSLLGYELPNGLRETMRAASAGRDQVDACWAWCDRVLERGQDGWIARGVVKTENVVVANGKNNSASTGMLSWLLELGLSQGDTPEDFAGWTAVIKDHLASSQTVGTAAAAALPVFRPSTSPQDYKSGIQSCRSEIHAGNSYELTLTTEFVASVPSTLSSNSNKALALYLYLRANNPSPYSAFCNLPTLDISILSSSPERFLRISNRGDMEMKPIKGTRKRFRCLCKEVGRACEGPLGAGCEEWCAKKDREVGMELSEDKKERAENLMIVDLIRSDLLSVCAPSSVRVPKLIQLETYETVHQLVTTVVGKLEEGVGEVEGIRRCFPPGSMTGAPKLRSVQILDELENHRPRGVYSGVLGYMGVDGATDLSVVIRTIVIKDGVMSIGAGGAITWLSDVDAEWEEVLTKVASVTR